MALEMVRLWWHTTVDVARSNVQAARWMLDGIDWTLTRMR